MGRIFFIKKTELRCVEKGAVERREIRRVFCTIERVADNGMPDT